MILLIRDGFDGLAPAADVSRFRTARVAPRTLMVVVGLLAICLVAMPVAADTTPIPTEVILAKGGNLKPSPIKGFFSVNDSGLGLSDTFPVSAIRYLVRERSPGTQTDVTTVVNLGDASGTITTLRIPADVVSCDTMSPHGSAQIDSDFLIRYSIFRNTD